MARTSRQSTRRGTVDAAEIKRFAAIAAEWWNPDGKFRPLHRLNPIRLTYVRDHLCAHFGRDTTARRPLSGLQLVDVGCGGGLLSEPLARMGAKVVGIDAAERNIRIAAAHAAESGLSIDYRAEAIEDLAASGERFDAVIALEVIEHVADITFFVESCAAVCRPGGALVLSTLNRTPKSYLFAIVGAEYVLGWLPRGTHNWRRFVRPSELSEVLRGCGLGVTDLTGLTYSPLADEWRLASDLTVNYMAFAVKGGDARL